MHGKLFAPVMDKTGGGGSGLDPPPSPRLWSQKRSQKRVT